MSVRVAGNQRRCEGVRVEVLATHVAQGANTVAVWLTVENMERRDKVACLSGSVRIQGPWTSYAEWQTREVVDQRTDLPAAQDCVADACRCPWLSLPKRQLQDAVDGNVMGSIVSGHRAILLPVGRKRKHDAAQIIIVGVINCFRPCPGHSNGGPVV